MVGKNWFKMLKINEGSNNLFHWVLKIVFTWIYGAQSVKNMSKWLHHSKKSQIGLLLDSIWPENE